MRLQFILSEIGIGLRRNVAMAVSVVLVTLVSLFLLGAGVPRPAAGRHDEGLLVRPGPGLDLPVRRRTPRRRRCADGEVTQAQKDQIQADAQRRRSSRRTSSSVYYESKQEAFDRFMAAVQGQRAVRQRHRGPDAGVLPGPAEGPASSTRSSRRSSTAAPGVESVAGPERGARPAVLAAEPAQVLLAGCWPRVTLLCAVLLVATTIRLTAFTRRRETGIMRLVGASNFFIQLPFILESMIAAAVGAALASVALVSLTRFEIQGRLLADRCGSSTTSTRATRWRSSPGCSSSGSRSLACRPSWRC